VFWELRAVSTPNALLRADLPSAKRLVLNVQHGHGKKVLEGFNLLEYGDRGKRKERVSVPLSSSRTKDSGVSSRSKLLRK
jgi:hypothetical protein